jgi:hypothetical protein
MWGKGSKGVWMLSVRASGRKLRGREERLGESASLSPPYRSPMASVTWWLSSLMEMCGT